MTALPFDPAPAAIALLAVAAAVAGFVDAIAGGGGLITLPSLLAAGLPPHIALATNKGQSWAGSGMALARFAQSGLLDRRRAWQSVPWALAGAAGGVAIVSLIPRQALSAIVMALLLGVAVLVLAGRTGRMLPEPGTPARTRPWWIAALVAAGIAAYDGFFGPGTGTFLIVAYAWLWHDAMDAASANAKVVNFCSNVAALAAFAVTGNVLWRVALPMAAGNAVGAWTGAHLTIRRGHTLVRWVVVAVSFALVLKLAHDYWM